MKQDIDNSFRITDNYDSITTKEVFPDLLKVLMAYALKLIGSSTLRLEKNKHDLAYDFAMETIKRYLDEPEKFDPTKNNDLVKFLKYYILKRLVSNFKQLGGQKSEIVYERDDHNGIKVINKFVKENDIHEMMDLEETLRLIQQQLLKDKDVLEIFELRYKKDYKRVEVCEELGISVGEYTNRIRRLDTVISRIKKQQSN